MMGMHPFFAPAENKNVHAQWQRHGRGKNMLFSLLGSYRISPTGNGAGMAMADDKADAGLADPQLSRRLQE